MSVAFKKTKDIYQKSPFRRRKGRSLKQEKLLIDAII